MELVLIPPFFKKTFFRFFIFLCQILFLRWCRTRGRCLRIAYLGHNNRIVLIMIGLAISCCSFITFFIRHIFVIRLNSRSGLFLGFLPVSLRYGFLLRLPRQTFLLFLFGFFSGCFPCCFLGCFLCCRFCRCLLRCFLPVSLRYGFLLRLPRQPFLLFFLSLLLGCFCSCLSLGFSFCFFCCRLLCRFLPVSLRFGFLL